MSFYTYEKLVAKAKEIKNNVEKYNALGGTTKWGYYFAMAVQNPKKNIQKITIADAPQPHGTAINKSIGKSEYIKLSKKLTTFIENPKNKRLPNYLRWGRYKITGSVYTKMYADILVYYDKHGKFPSSVTANSKAFANPKKIPVKQTLSPYVTTQGCSGMGQCTSYNCACNSLQQCFYRLTSIKVAESTISRWAGTTTSGTDHQGIGSAVAGFNRKYNKKIKLTWKNFTDLGSTDAERWKTLQNYINKGAVFCHLLYRDQYGHYEVPKTVGSENLAILNSLGDYCNYPAYCGYIETRSKSTQKRYIQGISQKSIAILTI